MAVDGGGLQFHSSSWLVSASGHLWRAFSARFGRFGPPGREKQRPFLGPLLVGVSIGGLKSAAGIRPLFCQHWLASDPPVAGQRLPSGWPAADQAPASGGPAASQRSASDRPAADQRQARGRPLLGAKGGPAADKRPAAARLLAGLSSASFRPPASDRPATSREHAAGRPSVGQWAAARRPTAAHGRSGRASTEESTTTARARVYGVRLLGNGFRKAVSERRKAQLQSRLQRERQQGGQGAQRHASKPSPTGQAGTAAQSTARNTAPEKPVARGAPPQTATERRKAQPHDRFPHAPQGRRPFRCS